MLSDLEVVAVKKTAEAQVPRVDGLLDGKVAIITGASRGIGAATARAFRQAGASVVLAARDGDALADVAGEIEQAGGEALAVPTDVGDPTSVEALVRRSAVWTSPSTTPATGTCRHPWRSSRSWISTGQCA